jgi:hypothetical protein
MNQTEKTARIERIRELIKLMRKHATEGHMPYVVDTLELMADLLERC